jgi:hypothetical protein
MAAARKTNAAIKTVVAEPAQVAPEETIEQEIQATEPTDNVSAQNTSGNLTHFKILNSVDVSKWIEKKKTGNTELSYLSWASAWEQVKKRYPDATYKIRCYGENQLPYVFDENTGYMCFTEMTIEGITHCMWLPVMDGANKAMKNVPYNYTTGFGQYRKEKTCAAADMFDINKTIMRCLVKNIGMFGLGLYIYTGEDLPSEPEDAVQNSVKEAADKVREQQANKAQEKLTEAKEKIQSALKKLLSDASPEDKASFAKTNIEPVLGIINYTMCDDLPKLNTLVKNLEKMTKQEGEN